MLKLCSCYVARVFLSHLFIIPFFFDFKQVLRTPVDATKVGDNLKPEGCFFAENVSYGRRVDPPNVLCKFACGKLEADSKPNYIGKDDSTVRRSVNRQ